MGRHISWKADLFRLFKFRYVDLLTGPFISLYNTLMKIFFIGSAGYVVYLMKFKFKWVFLLFNGSAGSINDSAGTCGTRQEVQKGQAKEQFGADIEIISLGRRRIQDWTPFVSNTFWDLAQF